ncbi:hypothetical protein C9374_007740 [Naegleria lovaniensis]|uniref:Uncharacterized protein n=1 Tax=Naegleria lovaniensis TaxID=51637 RepID=A0AA88GGN6_NAELO|nr:uncharacterized protein C9374_007740 [Naegleria lovaniensis]KAG2379102.1 hypothetical protein C9374_007740 [Naegleria lovaniensis]
MSLITCVLEDGCNLQRIDDYYSRIFHEFKYKMKCGKKIQFSGKFVHVNTISDAGKPLKHPSDVKISYKLAMIIVSDFANDRIVFFNLFSFQYWFSMPLNRPSKMDLDDNDDLIIVSNSSQLFKIDLRNRKEIWKIERVGLSICGIAIEKHSNRIFLCDISFTNPCIQIREQDGTFLSNFELPSALLYHPFSIAFDPICNNAYISCYYQHVIIMRSMDKVHDVKEIIGGYGEDIESLRQPRGILLDGKQLIVCDSCNCCIKLFSLDGHIIKSFGSKGIGLDQFRYPAAVCLNELNGELLVVDNTNHRILVYR